MLPLWGQQQKSLDDPRTIEDVISDMISFHKQDPEAHLGEGESLSSHKHEQVIDHPAQSVVSDKHPFGDYEVFPYDLGSFGWSFEEGEGSILDNSTISANMSSQDFFLLTGNMPFNGGDDYPEKDLVLQFRLAVSGLSLSNGSFRFLMGVDPFFGSHRLSIEKDGTSLYWRLRSSGVVVHSYLISSASNVEKYFRLYFDSIGEKIELYIGSTLVSTYSSSDWKKWTSGNFAFEMERNTNTSLGFSLTNFKSTYTLDIDI
jgi:hypothetical protein